MKLVIEILGIIISYYISFCMSAYFEDGYFISDAFTNTFNSETIEDAKLIKERQKIRMEAYKEIDEKWNVENQISVLTRIL